MGTASQALNNRPNVARETRARVVDAARALGYPIKSRHEAPATDVEVIGMLMKHDFGHPPSINPFYSQIQAGVEEECRRQHISLMYANIEVDTSNHPICGRRCSSEERIDGLLLIGTFIEDTVGMLKRRLDIPTVLIDAYAPNLPYDSVLIDNALGTRLAVEHLIEQGHTKIGLLGTNPDSPPSLLERRRAFRQVMRRHGLSYEYIEDSPLLQDPMGTALQQLLQRAPEVTAVFCAADIVALGVLSAARNLGISVPDELAIAGFDDIDMAAVVSPALTTVRVHKLWMGTMGVRQLLSRAAEPFRPKVTISVATDLVRRQSVCAVGDMTVTPQMGRSLDA